MPCYPTTSAHPIISAHPSFPSTSTVQKPIAWLGDGPQPLGSGSTTVCSIGGGGAPQRETHSILKLRWSMLYALGSVHALESCYSFLFLEQPRELRPCLTGVATRPPVAITQPHSCLKHSGTRSTLRDKHATCSGVPYIQANNFQYIYEAGLRLPTYLT